MKKIIILLIVFLLPLFSRVLASSWFYPLENTLQRSQYKKFGQYIDKEFYKGNDQIFPNQFVGYHAGVDLEIFLEEKNQLVPIYAVSDGKIIYYGDVSGYGGLILQKLNNGYVVLYGHLKLNQTKLKVGDKVKAGEILTYLGDAYSTETGGERKHLHFAIYKGIGQYFKGYEVNKTDLQNKWLDPLLFLKENNAVDPKPVISPTKYMKKEISKPLINNNTSNNFFILILNFLNISIGRGK